jgi:hypothetical protein
LLAKRLPDDVTDSRMPSRLPVTTSSLTTQSLESTMALPALPLPSDR